MTLLTLVCSQYKVSWSQLVPPESASDVIEEQFERRSLMHYIIPYFKSKRLSFSDYSLKQ